MRTKNTKLTTLIYLPYECDAVEEYLNKMAAKGWLLVSITSFFFKFQKTNQKNITYSVDILDKVSAFDTDAALEYREYCMVAGWTYICQTGKIHIFYTTEANNILPIHTDEEVKFKSVVKGSLYHLITQFFLTITLIFNVYNSLFILNTDFLLSSNSTLWSIVLVSFFIFANLIDFINFFLWVIKAKYTITEHKFIPYNSYKQLIKKNVLKTTYILALLLISTKFYFFDNASNKEFCVFLLLMLFLTIISMIYVQLFINKKRHLKITNTIVTIFSSLNSSVLILIIIVAVFLGDIYQQNQLPNWKANLTSTDFGYKENNDKSPHINFDKSILGEKAEYYDNSDSHLTYTIFESKYPFVINFDEKRLLSRLNKYNSDLTEEYYNLPYNVKVYSYKNKKSFVLMTANKVVNITKGFNYISDYEFLNIVCKKLFND